MMALDLFVLNRKAHVVAVKEALLERCPFFGPMRSLRKMAATTVSDIARLPVKRAMADVTIGRLASTVESFEYR